MNATTTTPATPHPHITITSFGYGHHDPAATHGADLVIDVRDHFRDPHIDPQLRALTGHHPEVTRKVLTTPGVRPFTAALFDTLAVLAGPAPTRPLRVAIGCVGGRHRSVVLAELLAAMARQAGWRPVVVHRHVHRPVLHR